eukprot:COSAG01_NODE_4560_length_4920_cov_21.560672_5_plen_106_part_00
MDKDDRYGQRQRRRARAMKVMEKVCPTPLVHALLGELGRLACLPCRPRTRMSARGGGLRCVQEWQAAKRSGHAKKLTRAEKIAAQTKQVAEVLRQVGSRIPCGGK